LGALETRPNSISETNPPVFVAIEQVETLVVLGLGNLTVTISIKRLKRELRITVDVKQLEACFVLYLGKFVVAVLVQHGKGGGRCRPNPGDETVLVRVKEAESLYVFLEGKFAVLVGIQQFDAGL
jgi:hypothetical protein